MTRRRHRSQAHRMKAKRYARNLVIIASVLFCFFAIIMLGTYLLGGLKYGWQITNSSKIELCESANDSNYQSIKEEIKAMVTKKIDETPTKVVFHIGGGNHQIHNYTLTVWYKRTNGNWYELTYSWLSPSISKKLDQMLCKLW